jgi:hypothetical protein
VGASFMFRLFLAVAFAIVPTVVAAAPLRLQATRPDLLPPVWCKALPATNQHQIGHLVGYGEKFTPPLPGRVLAPPSRTSQGLESPRFPG